MRTRTLAVAPLAICVAALQSGCADCDKAVQQIPSPNGAYYVELLDLDLCGGALQQPKRAIDLVSSDDHGIEMALIHGIPNMTIIWKSNHEIVAIIDDSPTKHPTMRSRKDWRGITLRIEYRSDIGVEVRNRAPAKRPQ